jgi:hypothetical protein
MIIGSNSSFVSIRKPPAQNMLPDTNEDQKAQPPILKLEALKVLGRLVRAFKARIESESRIIK